MQLRKSKLIPICLIIELTILQQFVSAQMRRRQRSENVVAEMQVVCQSDSMILKMNTNTPFNGMVYAKDAPGGSNCISEFKSSTNMTFKLPLKSCGTLFAEADDGIEYFNTVVVQPHMRLMTNQGKGYHIRCKYQTRERTIANTQFNVSASFLMQNQQAVATPLSATASMPSCTMKIFRSGRDDVAESVKIGDKLIMVIEIDQQDMYGMRITSCVVRDGLNLAEQPLINDDGCPVDENIMPKFEYTNNSTRAAVSFPAHKFPHTSSVYYQCNVRLCINANNGCEQPDCSANSASGNSTPGGGPRRKRFVAHEQHQAEGPAGPGSLPNQEARVAGPAKSSAKADMSFDVYSGLYVNDMNMEDSGSSDSNGQQVLYSRRSTGNEGQQSTDQVCLSVGKCAVMILLAGVASASVALMLACQVGHNRQRSSMSTGANNSRKVVYPSLQPVLHESYQSRRHQNMSASSLSSMR